MAIFNFNLSQYFEGYRYITSMVKYLRTSNKITRIKVSEDLQIPITSYRRLEEERNYKNEQSINKVAAYFKIDINIDYDLIKTVNDDFNEFYNCTYFGDIPYQTKMYNKLMLNFDNCKDNILLIPMNLAKLIFIISNVKFRERMNEIKSIINLLEHFFDDMTDPHKIIFNSYLCGFYAYTNEKREMEELAFYTLKLAENDEVLKPVLIYQLSINYFFLGDWSTSLYYAIKAKDGLVNTNNFNRLLYLKGNMASIFYKLSNYTEALDTLDKILIWTSFNQNDRLEYNSSLLSCYCLVKLNRYNQARLDIEKLYTRNSSKGELVMFLLYIYYKLDDKQRFELQKEFIKNINQEQKLYIGYYNISMFIAMLYERTKIDLIRKAFKELEKDFESLIYCNLVDIVKEEFNNISNKN